MADLSGLSPWLGAIPIVGSVASTLINNASTNAANAANRAFVLQQQQQQNQFNLDQQAAQNAYNSPASAMARFTAAGLNPNLIYGAAASGATFQASPVHAAPATFVQVPHPLVDFATPLQHVVSSMNDLRLGNAQSQNIQANIHNLNTDSDYKAGVLTDLTHSNALKADAETATVNAVRDPSVSLLNTQIGKNMADAQFSLSQSQTADIMRAPNLLVALQSLQNMVTSNLKDQAEISLINNSLDKLKAETSILQANSALINAGVQPGDGFLTRSIGLILNYLHINPAGNRLNGSGVTNTPY